MSIFAILDIAYIAIGAAIALAMIAQSWDTGDAVHFLFSLVLAPFVTLLWGPGLLVVGVFHLLAMAVQTIMDRRDDNLEGEGR